MMRRFPGWVRACWRRRRPVGWLLIALSVVVMAPGVLSTVRSTVSAAESDAPSIVWLATGDSYSSGTGVDGRMGDCRRAEEAYAPRVKRRLDTQGWDIRGWAFTPCHGATISRRDGIDFNDTVTEGQQSLLDQVGPVASTAGEPPVKVDLMTFTFGGNDIGFSEVIRRCAGIWTRPRLWSEEQCPYTEGELNERVDALEDGNNLTRRGRGIRIWDEDPWPGSLAFFYRQVHERHIAEDGVLIVVGYPRLFAPSEEWTDARCERVHRDDADMLGRVAERFDDVIARQRERAVGPRHNIRYVSIVEAFREGIPSFSDGGHELCGSGRPWLNGFARHAAPDDFPETTDEVLVDPLDLRDSYHPNADGHAAMAELLSEAILQLLPADETEPPLPTPVEDPGPAELDLARELPLQVRQGPDDCPPAPDSPLLPTSADCVSVLRLDLDGNGEDDRLLLYEDHGVGDPPERVALAVLAAGGTAELMLGRDFDPRFDGFHPIGIRDLNGDGGDDVLVVLVAGANTRHGTILTLHNGNLVAAGIRGDLAGLHLVFSEGGGMNNGFGFRCPDDGTFVQLSFRARWDDDEDDGWDGYRVVYRWDSPVELVESAIETRYFPGPFDSAQAYGWVETDCYAPIQ